MTDKVLPIVATVVPLDRAYKASSYSCSKTWAVLVEKYSYRLVATYSTGSLGIQVCRALAVLVSHPTVFLHMDQP